MFGKKEKGQPRFIVKESQSLGLSAVEILLDTKTGVNYLFMESTTMSGLTPLLDENGDVVIDKNVPGPQTI